MKTANGIRAILFDKDGTLIDYEKTWGPVNREIARLAAAGDRALESRLLDAIGVDGRTGRTRADSLVASGNTAEIAAGLIDGGCRIERRELVATLDRMFVAAAETAAPLTDIRALFERLGDRAIGVASSDNEAAIRRTLARLGVGAAVGFVAGYDSGHGHKPQPGMALAFCRAAQCETREMAMVGDNRHDLEMGRAAGAGLVVGVLTGTGDRASLGGLADAVIDSIAALPDLLGNAD